MSNETHYFEQQDGPRIAYKIFESEEAKNDVPLVIVPALWGTKELFMGVEEKLAKNQKVIIFDNRGLGESSVASLTDTFTVNSMAQDTIGLIKHLGIKRFNLMGWCMGGYISLCVALNLPEDLKLEKLIIVSGYAQGWEHPIFEGMYNLPKLDPPESVEVQKNEIMEQLEKSYTDYLLEHPDEQDKISNVLFNAKRPFEIYKRQWEAIKQSENLVPKLKEIKVPTLIFHGEMDTIVSIKESEIIDREIPDSKFHRIPGVGHMLPVIQGFGFTTTINGFLV